MFLQPLFSHFSTVFIKLAAVPANVLALVGVVPDIIMAIFLECAALVPDVLALVGVVLGIILAIFLELAALAENCPVEDMRYYLSDIDELIGFHFREEEEIMRECQYAGYARHKADHDRLLQEIGDIKRTLTDNSDSAEKAALARTIEDWFSVHFRTYDKAFHEMSGAA